MSISLPCTARGATAFVLASLCFDASAQTQPRFEATSPDRYIPHASTNPVELAPIAIVGSREPTALDQLVADVEVIGAAELQQTSADSLEDLLRRHGGVQLSRNGGPGQSASLLMRGAAASHLVVLLDGVRIGSASLGQTDLASIDIASIEQIEIYRGPASSLWGADAVGGVINLVTRRGQSTARTTLNLAAGNYGSMRAQVGTSARVGNWDYAVNASRDSSDGVSAVKPGDSWGLYNPDRDGYRRASAQLAAGWNPNSDNRVGASPYQSLLHSRYDSGYGATTALDYKNRATTRVAALEHDGKLTSELRTKLRFSNQKDDAVSGAITQSRFKTQREQLLWQNAWGTQHQWVLAFEGTEERLDAGAIPGAPERKNLAAIAGYSGGVGSNRWQIDVRHDDHSTYGSRTTGKVGWSKTLDKAWKFRLIAGTTFRAPTYNDLYYPGYGVASIKPESGRSVEASLLWRAQQSQAGVTLYRNLLREMIAYEADVAQCPAGYTYGCARNFGRARLQGATLTAAHASGPWQLRAAVDWVDATDSATGQRLPRRAAHQENVSVDWAAHAWRLSASWLEVGSRSESGNKLGSYQLVDLRAQRELTRGWRAEVKLNNALNKRYEPVLDAQPLGRQLWVGVRYQSDR